MSDSPANPYSSPVMEEASATPGASAGIRPHLLTLACVCCMVFGTLGIIMGLFSVPMIFFGKEFQQAISPASAGNPMAAQQQRLQLQMAEVQSRYLAPLLAANLGKLVVGVLLLYCGCEALTLSTRNRRLLIVAVLVAVAFELGNGVLLVVIQRETSVVMLKFFEDTQGAPQPPGFEQIMRMSMNAGVAIAVLWQAVKIGFFGGIGFYLSRPHVVSLYQSQEETLTEASN